MKSVNGARFVGGDDITIRLEIDAADSNSLTGSEVYVQIELFNGTNLATYSTEDGTIAKELDSDSQIVAVFKIDHALTQGFQADTLLNYHVRVTLPNGDRVTPDDGFGNFRILKNPQG